MIPKIIIQTYKSYDELPKNIKLFIKTIKKKHPEFEYMYFNDDDILNFITPFYISNADKFIYLTKRIPN